MAIIKTSGMITEIVGSVGGTTFQRSRWGLIMKNKPKGAHGNTVRRSVQTNIMHYIQHQWLGLSVVQRTEWNNYALFRREQIRSNRDRCLTGHQIFIKYNFYRVLTGRAITLDCLYGFTSLSEMEVTLSRVGGNFFMSGSRSISGAVEFFVIFITFPVSPSISNPGSRLRYIPNTWSGGGSYILNTDYISVFGRIPDAGETVHYKYRLIDLVGYYTLPWRHSAVTL